MQKLFLYINTLKSLKASQIFYRLWYRFTNVKVDTVDPQLSLTAPEWNWSGCNYQKQSLIDDHTVTFLSLKSDISSIECWNDDVKEKLWLYNLHYFDDLNAVSFNNRSSWHKSLIERWINENPPCKGNGWEPYPLSLRMVNWCKWFSKEQSVNLKWNQSLFQQGQALLQQIEYHIMGNHLFSNAKALVFAGVYFDKSDCLGFLKKGLEILDKEIAEQFLEDGGHFELSPMYHQIMLWDLLDLIELTRISNHQFLVNYLEKWEKVVELSVNWLSAMLHPDKNISFFNDAAFGIGPSLPDINNYLSHLGFALCSPSKNKTMNLFDSGFVSVSKFKDSKLIVDIGDVGPIYQPGHGHADTLSFELSIFGDRLFVNSGTSMYGTGKERDRQRSSSAHNTLIVGNTSSSEVWGGFRVANRAEVLTPLINETSDNICISALHDGYKKKFNGLFHKRTWYLAKNKLEIIDELLGKKSYLSEVRFHLHPDVKIIEYSESSANFILNGNEVRFSVHGGDVNLYNSSWHPEFGKSIPSKVIVVNMKETKIRTEMSWANYE
jgi:uncharacterized heparinase superfamily protein